MVGGEGTHQASVMVGIVSKLSRRCVSAALWGSSISAQTGKMFPVPPDCVSVGSVGLRAAAGASEGRRSRALNAAKGHRTNDHERVGECEQSNGHGAVPPCQATDYSTGVGDIMGTRTRASVYLCD